MFTSMQLMFAGIWPMLFHWGLGVFAIGVLLAAAFFTTSIPFIGPYLTGLRSQLLWAAAGVGLLLAGQWIGAHDANRRCEAKTIVIEKIVTKVVKGAERNAGKRLDKWDTNQ